MNLVAELITVVGIFILAFGAVRALEIGKVLVSRAFRGRAFWLGGLMVLLGGTNSFGFIASGRIGSYVNTVLSVILLVVVYLFVDRNLAALKEVDFFHRDTYSWGRIRRPGFWALLVVSALLLIASIFVDPTSPSVSAYFVVTALLFFGVAGGVLAYAAAAIVVGARRTPDKTMRTFSRLFGIALALAVVSFTVWIPLGLLYPLVENLVSNLFAVGSDYLLYLTAMSLTTLGKVERRA